MKIEITKTKNFNIVRTILFMIMGAILIINPGTVLSFLSILIGTILMISGVWKIISAGRTLNVNPLGKPMMFKGIIIGLLGLVFILFDNILANTIGLFVGGWIMFSGINNIINAFSLDKKSSRFIVSLVISTLLILLSIYVIFNGSSALKPIGIIMVVYAAIEMFGLVFDRVAEKKESYTEGESTLIIPKKK